VPERKRGRPPRETFDRLAVATDRTPSGCGPHLAVPRQQQRKDQAVDLAEANRPETGGAPWNQNVDPSRGAKSYRLVAARATATAAVHDGEDHDGNQSSQRGSDPKGSAREWHSGPPFHSRIEA